MCNAACIFCLSHKHDGVSRSILLQGTAVVGSFELLFFVLNIMFVFVCCSLWYTCLEKSKVDIH